MTIFEYFKTCCTTYLPLQGSRQVANVDKNNCDKFKCIWEKSMGGFVRYHLARVCYYIDLHADILFN